MTRISQRSWLQPHAEALKEGFARGDSFECIAVDLNAKFGTSYTRNACIGRANRMGLVRDAATLHSARVSAAVKREEQKKLAHNPDYVPPIPRPCALPAPRIKREAIPTGSQASRTIHAIKLKFRPVPPTEIDATPLRCAEVQPLHLSLLDLKHDSCRWPYGGFPSNAPITFCGHWCAKGFSYCLDHDRLSRGVGTTSERAAHRVSAERAA